MRPFSLERATDSNMAATLVQSEDAGFLAGGTTLLDLMKLDVLRPRRVIDINPLQAEFGEIHVGEHGVALGALVRMSAAADHPELVDKYPVVAQSLRLAASAQLRNMATLGGNVLQRTRCPYFRDPSWQACNKRSPGTGCAAIAGVNRRHAVLGVSEHCIAPYPGDFATALAALGADVRIRRADGQIRTIPLEALHRLPGTTPHIETDLQKGELITGFFIPAGEWTRRSFYLKIRDRASYDFALASAAVALDLAADGTVHKVRIGLGGVAAKPWRSHAAEQALTGKILDEASASEAARAAFAHAVTHGENDFKPELGRRTLVRALLEARDLEI